MNEKEMLEYMKKGAILCQDEDVVDSSLYDKYGVKRGLRDLNGHGVLTGVTNISKVVSSKVIDGKEVFCDGELWYRGYNVIDMVKDFGFKRFGFEEMAYLLLFGELPNADQLAEFRAALGNLNHLPTNFTRDVIMKAPSHDIMNSMTKSVLTLASYDDYEVADLSIPNVLRQCMALISEFPMLAVYGYCAYNHYERDDSMYIHRPNPALSTSENFLRMLRPDKQYTELEAQVLDAALVLHMEHGGGNNSSFTTHVVSSSMTDTYSVIAAAIGSLKGPRHGGANIKVVHMFDDMEENVKDWTSDEEVGAYLEKLLNKEAFDNAGLIYGVGHAIYSKSDPRARILKSFVEKLAKAKGFEKEFALYEKVEELAPKIISGERKMYKGVSINVDFYSGFVYKMLGLPEELYTPIFAMARIVGWSAHRMEELAGNSKIIRPAYKAVGPQKPYLDIKHRK